MSGGWGGLRKPGPPSQEFPCYREGTWGIPWGWGSVGRKLSTAPEHPEDGKRLRGRGGPSQNGPKSGLGCRKAVGCVSRAGGLLGLAGGPRGRQRSGSVPPLGAGLGKPHPEGLAVYAGQRQKQQQQQEEEEEEKQPQPGLGEEKAAQAGGGGWVPGRRLWKDKVRQEPWELSQGGLGHGGWTREGQGQHCWWRPPPPRRAVLTCVPAAAAATAVGLGVPNPGAPAPLCRAAGVLHLLWLSLPAPLSLPGDGERGREGPRGSQSPLP